MDVMGTNRFFKRKMPELRQMEVHAVEAALVPAVRVFFREMDDSEYPSRVGVQLTPDQCDQLAEELRELAANVRNRMVW